MAAFRPDDAEERDLRLEDYGQHVTTDAFYPDWDGLLDDVTKTAELLMEDTESLIVESLRDELRVIDAILDRAAAA